MSTPVHVVVCITATKLVFTSSPQALSAGSVSGVITVQRRNASGAPATCGATTVDLTSSSGAGSFRDAGNTSTITSVTIPTGSSDATFRYSDTVAGTPSVTAADHAAALTQATQTETVTAGTAAVIRVETAADGSGTVVPGQTVSAGSQITVYSISRDTYGNFVANAATDVGGWSFTNKTGGVANGDLAPAIDLKSAVFTGHLVGTATIHAAKSGLVSVDSGTITVIAGSATQIRVESAADGSGVVVPAQNVTAGNSIIVYAISRDAQGNFVANAATDAAGWSLANISGGVVSGDLVAASDLRSATFTGHAVGAAKIHAAKTGLASTDSGTITVNAGTFAKLLLTAPGETAAPGTINGKTGTPTAVTAGVAFNVTVQAVDANWNPVSSTDTVSITSSDASATLPSNAALVGGTKTFSVTLKTAGSKTVTANDVTDNTKTANSSTITVNAGTPATATFSTQPGGGPEGTAWATQPSVTIKDAFNNLVTGSPVTLTISTNPSGGTLNCPTNPTNTNGSGIAAFAGCSIDKAGTGYKLTATDGSATVASSAFNITGPQVTNVSINNKTSGGSTAGRPEAGDTIAITYSAGLKMTSVCSSSTLGNASAGSITPNSTSTTVTLTKTGGKTVITFASTDCTLNIGSASLTELYVGTSNGSTVTFGGSSVAWDGSNTITVTLGGTVGGTGSLITDTVSSPNTFTPNTAATDPAGNAVVSTAFNWTSANF